MKFVTFLNSGCLEICKNMLKSAELVGINLDDFYIACLDNNSLEAFKEYKNAYLYINQELTEYQDWSFDESSNFRSIVQYKWKIIEEQYLKHKDLVWVDTDIVFKENPTEYLNSFDKICFQSDLPGSLVCTGFMKFVDSDLCRTLISLCASYEGQDDQLIFNHIIKDYIIECELLNEDLFPNGNSYYKLGKKSKAIIVHNNWMVGIDTKIQRFKDENLWFI
jgi:hypothetical protein